MKLLSEAFGLEEKKVKKLIFNTGIVTSNSTTKGTPESRKTTPDIERVGLDTLERLYMINPTIFNGINKIVQTIISAGYELKSTNSRTKKSYQDFLDNLGNSGNDITWEEMLTLIFKHQVLYGNAWVELIYNKQGNRIVDLDMIDPKKMDFAKKSDGSYALDIYGKPVGYVETLPYGNNVAGLGDKPPEGVSSGANQIFFLPKRIAHFKLFTVGDGFKGIGLVEPAFQQSKWKLNVEKALANSIHNSGFPMKKIKVGDTTHEPNPEQIQSILEKIKSASFDKILGLPFYVDVDYLQAKGAENMEHHLDYFQNQEITALGVPKPFITGGGEETNRATLNNQERMFRQTSKDLIRRTITSIEKYIFGRMAKIDNRYSPIPEIVWYDIEETAEIERAELLLQAVKEGILKPEEIKDEILKIKMHGNEKAV